MGRVRFARRQAAGSAARLPADLHPLLRRVFVQRGVAGATELDLALRGLLPPQGLGGLEAATGLLQHALEAGQRILVVGDFDADGATSTALAIRALRAMGADDVRYLVPNRFEYGYGLTPEIVEVAAGLSPDLLVTVDNGVSSIEGVRAARSRGMRVLITDHHLPGERLPEADAMVNPSLPGQSFAGRNLAGVGVAFYVLAALRRRLQESGWFRDRGIPQPSLARWLDIVALGTVADVVPLDHNNRILVQHGLRLIHSGRGNPGILALLQVAGRDPARTVSSDLGFAVGPRLNAAGRLTDMSAGIECLLADDPDAAMGLARELDALNRERRDIEARMRDEALAHVERMDLTPGDGELPPGLCLYDPAWHQGVIGILAARIREQCHRPVVAFADGAGTELKGSARSMSGVHIRDVLDAVAARHPGLITRFGGHAMAAGLVLPRDHLDAFRQAFGEEVGRHVDVAELNGSIVTDGELQERDLTLDVAGMLREVAPWGQGFPEPLFDGRFEVLDRRVVGERHLRLRLRPAGGSRMVDGILFNYEHCGWDDGVGEVQAAYRLDVNRYQGVSRLQLVITHLLEA